MKIYLASSHKNEEQPNAVKVLRAAGHEVYDFKNPEPGNKGFGWRQCVPEKPPWSAAMTRTVLSHPLAERGFSLDFAAMQWADAVVMLQPCGRSAALELGWGCGAGKLTAVVLADGREPELMVKCAHHLVTSLDELVEVLRAEETRLSSSPTAALRAKILRHVAACREEFDALLICGANWKQRVAQASVEAIEASIRVKEGRATPDDERFAVVRLAASAVGWIEHLDRRDAHRTTAPELPTGPTAGGNAP